MTCDVCVAALAVEALIGEYGDDYARMGLAFSLGCFSEAGEVKVPRPSMIVLNLTLETIFAYIHIQRSPYSKFYYDIEASIYSSKYQNKKIIHAKNNIQEIISDESE